MTELQTITSITEFAEEARGIINRFGLINAIEIQDFHVPIVRVFDLLHVAGSDEEGDEVISENPPRWVFHNMKTDEIIVTKDAGWALCCFITAYVALIEHIENADATREDEEW